MSSVWRYLFVGIALMTWPKTWPVGIDHCIACYCFHGNLSTYAADLRHYLDTNVRAEKCVPVINIGLKTSSDLYTCLRMIIYAISNSICYTKSWYAKQRNERKAEKMHKAHYRFLQRLCAGLYMYKVSSYFCVALQAKHICC